MKVYCIFLKLPSFAWGFLTSTSYLFVWREDIKIQFIYAITNLMKICRWDVLSRNISRKKMKALQLLTAVYCCCSLLMSLTLDSFVAGYRLMFKQWGEKKHIALKAKWTFLHQIVEKPTILLEEWDFLSLTHLTILFSFQVNICQKSSIKLWIRYIYDTNYWIFQQKITLRSFILYQARHLYGTLMSFRLREKSQQS